MNTVTLTRPLSDPESLPDGPPTLRAAASPLSELPTASAFMKTLQEASPWKEQPTGLRGRLPQAVWHVLFREAGPGLCWAPR